MSMRNTYILLSKFEYLDIRKSNDLKKFQQKSLGKNVLQSWTPVHVHAMMTNLQNLEHRNLAFLKLANA